VVSSPEADCLGRIDIEDPDVKTTEIQKVKGQIKQNLVQVGFPLGRGNG